MQRTRHHFALQGATAEVDIIVGRPEEWPTVPESVDPAWSVDSGRLLVACRLVVAGLPLPLRPRPGEPGRTAEWAAGDDAPVPADGSGP